MGVLNVTPDSFYDGGRYLTSDAAWARLRRIAGEGAAICDVGAESTRPGAEPVPPEEQQRRLGGLLAAMRDGGSPVAVSIDTTRSAVAEAALDAGAVMVNDTSAGRDDPAMLPLVAERGVAICLMHRRAEARAMQRDPGYGNVVSEVRDDLGRRVEVAVARGVRADRIVLDPGIGFGKTLDHNLRLLAGLGELRALGTPILVGVSRKSMFDRLLGRDVDERLPASLGAALAAVSRGADVVRAHDVAPTVDALAAWSAVERVA